ncbi:MAG: TIGR02147 family protein [Bdellovibrionota bacterium]
MKLYDCKNYKEFVLNRIHSMPKRGHGQFLKISKLLSVHTTMVTHIFKGEANLSIEQALKLCSYLGLAELESDYFINLVQLARAGDKHTKDYFEQQIEKLRKNSLNLKVRLQAKNVLEDIDQSVFYSEWFYTAVRLLSAINDYQDTSAMAEALDLPLNTVNKVIQFLSQVGLCKQENDKITYAPKDTYVNRNSKYVSQHHRNWRLKLLQKLDQISEDELVFTNPVTISDKDFAVIREELVRLIEKFKKISEPSNPETLCCFTLDWRRIVAKKT